MNSGDINMETPNSTGDMPGKDVSWARWFFLGMLSIALCSVLPFTILSPLPLVFAFLLYGRSKGILLGGICFGLLVIASLFKVEISSFLLGAFSFTFVVTILISEIFFRKINPKKGLVMAGLGLVGVLGLLLIGYAAFSETTLLAQLEEGVTLFFDKIKEENAPLFAGGGEEARVLKEMMSDPKAIATEILQSIPKLLFLSVFLGLWVNILMTLKNRRFWRGDKLQYPYFYGDFVHFRVPEFFVYPLIFALIMMIGGEYLLGTTGVVIGENMLYCLGIFYFFHGFGVFLDLLTYMRIYRFLRTFLIILTIFMAWKVVAIVGVFDLWLNFRRFFIKKEKKDEGDS